MLSRSGNPHGVPALSYCLCVRVGLTESVPTRGRRASSGETRKSINRAAGGHAAAAAGPGIPLQGCG